MRSHVWGTWLPAWRTQMWFELCSNIHLGDDKTVVKMGRPFREANRCGPPVLGAIAIREGGTDEAAGKFFCYNVRSRFQS